GRRACPRDVAYNMGAVRGPLALWRRPRQDAPVTRFLPPQVASSGEDRSVNRPLAHPGDRPPDHGSDRPMDRPVGPLLRRRRFVCGVAAAAGAFALPGDAMAARAPQVPARVAKARARLKEALPALHKKAGVAYPPKEVFVRAVKRGHKDGALS